MIETKAAAIKVNVCFELTLFVLFIAVPTKIEINTLMKCEDYNPKLLTAC